MCPTMLDTQNAALWIFERPIVPSRSMAFEDFL